MFEGFICLLVGVVPIILIIVASNVRYANAVSAEKDYRLCLETLKNDPHNPELQHTAVSKGRKAYKAWKVLKKFSGDEETAILNDINAACAAAPVILATQITKKELVLEARICAYCGSVVAENRCVSCGASQKK
jgi:hypothetical protein